MANSAGGGNCLVSGTGVLTSAGHNLSSDATCNFAGPGNIVGQNPNLGPLQNNGGPTSTHALCIGSGNTTGGCTTASPASPAIDQGSIDTGNNCADLNSAVVATDQRGVSRPQGPACDIGAYEVEVPCDLAITKTSIPNPVPSGGPMTISLTVTNVGTAPCQGVTKVTDGPDPWLTGALVSSGSPPWNCSVAAGTTVSCTWNTSGTQPVPVGQLPKITITGNVMASPHTAVTNCVTVDNPNDPNTPANANSANNHPPCVVTSVTNAIPTPTPTITPTPSCLDPGGLNISTGTGGIGNPDPIWTVISSTGNPLPAYGVTSDNAPATWASPPPNTHWIDPNNTGGAIGDPSGNYRYETSFTVPSGVQSLALTSSFAADNDITYSLIGPNSPPPLYSQGPTTNAFHLLIPANPSPFTNPPGKLKAGKYTLRADVVNTVAVTNPTGLLVVGNVTCVASPPACDLELIKTVSPNPVQVGQVLAISLAVTNIGALPCAGVTKLADGPLPWLTVASVATGGVAWNCSVAPPNPGATVSCTWNNSGNDPVLPGQHLNKITITGTVKPAAPGSVTNCAAVSNPNDISANAINNRSCVKIVVTSGIPSEICGIKFNDVNGNGVQDTGDLGLANWTISATGPGLNGPKYTAVTAADGTYCFSGLGAGSYTVAELPQAYWVQTFPTGGSPHTVTVPPGTNNVDFGNHCANCCPLCPHVGDANGDGVVNSVDALLMLQFNAGLVRSLANEASADVNGDGHVDSRDAALVLQAVAGLIPTL